MELQKNIGRGIEDERSYLEHLKSLNKKYCFFLKHKNEFIGNIQYSELDEVAGLFELNWIGLVPEYRGRGIGKEILLKTAQLLGIIKINLMTQDNCDQAIQLYENLGFEKKN